VLTFHVERHWRKSGSWQSYKRDQEETIGDDAAAGVEAIVIAFRFYRQARF
jgi:hypothetical protein